MRKWDFVTYTHNKKRVQEAKLVRGYVSVKSVGKDAQGYFVTALAVDFINLHTRPS